VELDGNPVNGQICYAAVNDLSLTQTIVPGDAQGYLIVPKFTNVDIRIIVDVDLSATYPLMLIVSSGSNFSLSGSMLLQGSSALFSQEVSTRASILIQSTSYDFNVARFYIVVYNLAPATSTQSTTYRSAFLQPSVTIDLFVFFSVFFSSFFLFLAVVALGFKGRTMMQERQVQQNTLMQMEVRIDFLNWDLLKGHGDPSVRSVYAASSSSCPRSKSTRYCVVV
jgi:hypothetical protein